MVGRATAADAFKGAVDFTRRAWRRAGLAQLVMAAGLAMMFVSLRAAMQPAATARLWNLGFLLSLAAWAPLWAALHRLALGGAAAGRVRFFGLQFDRTELRFLGLGLVAVMSLVLMVLPLVGISAAIFILFRPLGLVALGPLGSLQISFLIAATVWLAGVGALAYAGLRFAFAPSATVSKRRIAVLETWPMTADYQRAVGAGWLLAQAPMLLCIALLVVMDAVEMHDRGAFSSRWPLFDAWVGGAILGFTAAFIEAPLTAGVLALLYRRQRHWRARFAARVPPPAAHPVRLPATPERRWEPLAIRGAISESFPRLDQGA
jgi:hypothetical protein